MELVVGDVVRPSFACKGSCMVKYGTPYLVVELYDGGELCRLRELNSSIQAHYLCSYMELDVFLTEARRAASVDV